MNEWTINVKVAVAATLFLTLLTITSFLLFFTEGLDSYLFNKATDSITYTEYGVNSSGAINMGKYANYDGLETDKQSAKNMIRSNLGKVIIRLGATELSEDHVTAYDTINTFINNAGSTVKVTVSNDMNEQIVLNFTG